MTDQPPSALAEVPRLPQRAAIYIAPDGSVKFGALFEDLVPVAEAVSGSNTGGHESRLRRSSCPLHGKRDAER